MEDLIVFSFDIKIEIKNNIIVIIIIELLVGGNFILINELYFICYEV